jgi:predicted dehydrogenase
MSKKVKTAIIGCGGIANNKHMPSIKTPDNVEMVAFCDLIKEKAEKARKDYGTADAKVYTDYRELLLDKDIDVVHVCTPNIGHSEITVAALEAGKNVLCEKPMAKTAKEARAMVEAAKKSGKVLSIGYQNRYRADSTYLKRAVERGDLGEIYFAKAHAVRRRAVPTWGVFLDEEKQGGGPLIDIGTHALDLTLWLMNNYKPKSVMGNTYKKLSNQTETGNAFGDWDPKQFTVEDSAFGFITMEDGATIYLESSWALNTLDVLECQSTLCGTKAGADMRAGLRLNKAEFGKLVVTTPDLGAGGVAFFDGKTCTPEQMEQKVFYSAVTEGTELIVKPEQALMVTEILEAIYTSSKTGEPVYFNK